MTAIREAWKAGLLQRAHWLPNLVSGLVVGVVALPLAMAFAIASGVKPEQGIYTAIIAGVLTSLFGGSRLQISGPTGAFIVILAGITAKYGVDGLQIATLMAGIMLLLLGLARMGSIIKFIPNPVIVGFTAGIAVIIWVGQWRDFFGLPAVAGQHFHEKLWHLLQVLPDFHPVTTALALGSLAIVILTPKAPGLQRVPGPLLALAAATTLQGIFQFDGVATIGSAFGGIPQGLPTLTIPDITLSRVIELVGPAFTIAMLGAIESLLSAVVADGMAGTRHDSNQELVGQGIANIASPLFGGFAATGAIARTATNIRNGATSPLSGVVHALTLLLIILFMAPLAVHIPLCALSAILFFVAWNMSEAKHFINIVKRATRADVVILVMTFLMTVFTDLVVAVNIGVILATLLFLRRMSTAVEVQQLSSSELEVELRGGKLPDGVLVYTIEGPFFFGAVENFERALANTRTDPRRLVIRLKRVPFMDITGIQTLEEVLQKFVRRGVVVVLCEANWSVKKKLLKAGTIQKLGRQNYYDDFARAVENPREQPGP